MEAPMKLIDYGLSIYWGFIDSNLVPKHLDPRIGTFEVSSREIKFDGDSLSVQLI